MNCVIGGPSSEHIRGVDVPCQCPGKLVAGSDGGLR